MRIRYMLKEVVGFWVRYGGIVERGFFLLVEY